MGGESKTSSFFFPYDPHSPGSVAMRETNMNSAKSLIVDLLAEKLPKHKILRIAHNATPYLPISTLENLYQEAVKHA